MAKVQVLFLLAVLAVICTARKVSVGELKSSLAAHGVPGHHLSTWECIVQHESNFETTAINHSSGDHGLFQISQIYWCSPPGSGCGVSCASLRDDDIHNDIDCVLKIFREHERLSGNGFNAWVAYKYCH